MDDHQYSYLYIDALIDHLLNVSHFVWRYFESDFSKDSSSNLRACSLIFLGSNFFLSLRNFSTAPLRWVGSCFLKKVPVSFSTTVSKAPPFSNAITGLPLAIASNGIIPKSSS